MQTPSKYAWRQVQRSEAPKRPAQERVLDFRATDAAYDEETASEQASRCIQCVNPTCVQACPLEIAIPDLLALTSEQRFSEAAQLLLATHSLPEVFTQICNGRHLCEAACVLAAKSEPPAIGSIARFLLNYANAHHLSEPPPEAPNGQKVTIVGSGLCGLIAADALSKQGYAVTITDSHAKPGGRVINGLPGFKVDPELVERRIEILKGRGVRFQMNTVLGTNVSLEQLRARSDSVLIAFGRSEPMTLDIPGAQLRGVEQAFAFVLMNSADVSLHRPTLNVQGRDVVVLGGGDTALDAVRTAIRCGAARVTCIYRRDRLSLPANPESVEDAIEEGGRFLFQSQPIAIVGDEEACVRAVRCSQTIPGPIDGSGRHTFEPTNTMFDVAADIVLVAYGFRPPQLPRTGDFARLTTDEAGRLVVSAEHMTNLPGVFAGGSVVCGAAPLAVLVRDARKAGFHVDEYLRARRAASTPRVAVKY